MKPPVFKGGIEPMKAEAWVLGIEKLFEVFPCTEPQKVQLAAFTHEDEARRLWMVTRTIHLGLTWDRFLELFYDKYFPQSMRDKKVTEFETLRQGNKTVAEYETQFAELARFAPHMVDTDYKKARKFEGGLRGAILDRVNMLKLPTYVDVLERAVIAEGNLAAQNRISEWKGKRQNNQWSKGSITPPNKRQNSGNFSITTPTHNSTPVCPNCGRQHRGTCHWKTGACFKCGKTGHLVRDCPQWSQQKGNTTVTSSAGSTPTPNAKAAAKPMNNKDIARKACELQLGDIRVYANLLPLDMTSFDVILGMDWLSDYGATINGLTKKINFRPPGQLEAIVQGQEEQVMNRGIDVIPVVREFSDVFPEELPGQLIDREIEFIIEVAPGTQPISKTPYRMSPAEMKELKI
ncbi:uncharacterized protein LOC114308927 [Camellia sinensis]|uniref:uncharacterized protein LOC114308927 n=1 Tax=Camellia sinensis TaxID=4442 RepID=UPI0010360CD8|nr:uncharacterized protein LOC114308927 [Camellia sinensis]